MILILVFFSYLSTAIASDDLLEPQYSGYLNEDFFIAPSFRQTVYIYGQPSEDPFFIARRNPNYCVLSFILDHNFQTDNLENESSTVLLLERETPVILTRSSYALNGSLFEATLPQVTHVSFRVTSPDQDMSPFALKGIKLKRVDGQISHSRLTDIICKGENITRRWFKSHLPWFELQ